MKTIVVIISFFSVLVPFASSICLAQNPQDSLSIKRMPTLSIDTVYVFNSELDRTERHLYFNKTEEQHDVVEVDSFFMQHEDSTVMRLVKTEFFLNNEGEKQVYREIIGRCRKVKDK